MTLYERFEKAITPRTKILHFCHVTNLSGQLFPVQRAITAQNSQCHGQIEAGAFFLDIGRRQVDGDVGGRNIVSGILQRGADALAALAHRGIGQANGVKVIFVGADAGDVNLNLDDIGINAIHRGAQSFE